MILSTAIYNISGILDAQLYSTTMARAFNQSSSDTAAQYGSYTGYFKTLANIPIAISNAISSSMIPVMARYASSGEEQELHKSISMGLRFAVLIGMPCSVGLTVLGGPIITVLFGENVLASNMTVIGSFAVLFYSISTITNAVLQGSNHMRLPVIHAAVSLVLHALILVACMLLFNLGIYSVVISYMLFAFFMCIMNAISIKRHLGYRQEIRRTFVLPFICSLVMGGSTYALKIVLQTYITRNSYIITALCILLAVVLYAFLIFITGCISADELRSFPYGRKLVRIGMKLHLIR